VKEGNTFWRTKAALEALVNQYRSSDDEDYRSKNLSCGLKSVIRIRDGYGSGSEGSGCYV
jgi:hypothetical protein